MIPLLFIGGSIIIDIIVVLIVFVIVGYIVKLILGAFPPLANPPARNIVYALLLLLLLVFILYRYLGVHLP